MNRKQREESKLSYNQREESKLGYNQREESKLGYNQREESKLGYNPSSVLSSKQSQTKAPVISLFYHPVDSTGTVL